MPEGVSNRGGGRRVSLLMSQSSGSRRVWLLLALAALVFFVVLPWMGRGGDRPLRPAETPISWASELPADLDGPALVYFTATWCGPCQTMKENVWPDEAVVDAAKPYLPVMIDIDQNPQLAARFGVDSIPHVVLLDAEGKESERLVGYHSADDLAGVLRENAPR